MFNIFNQFYTVIDLLTDRHNKDKQEFIIVSNSAIESDNQYENCLNTINSLYMPYYETPVADVRTIIYNKRTLRFMTRTKFNTIKKKELKNVIVVNDENIIDKYFNILDVHDFVIVCYDNTEVTKLFRDFQIATRNMHDTAYLFNTKTAWISGDRYRFVSKSIAENALRGFRGKVFKDIEFIELMEKYVDGSSK